MEPEESVRWRDVEGTNSKVLKVWELEEHPGVDRWPEIVLLWVSDSDYRKHSHHAKGFMDFVNDHKFFSKPVVIPGPWVTLSSVDEEDPPTDWILMMSHGKRSTMIVSALPKLKRTDPPPKPR